MNNRSTVISFSYFQEQTVTKVNTDNTLPFSLGFSKGGLVAECPWRLHLAWSSRLEISTFC
ncbi:hypothetical protein [Priestia megaterium]|uniref:hypothetical protein n=1 Tax=Priestia megaterium TaxID=1404 RepID=UPI002A6B5D6C|nr:hypothetical protein [Priestia megaterium]MDY0940927.1 hypothetical protein [Priestia megaterium]